MSACREDAVWLGRHLAGKLRGRRFPLSGTFELTLACNLGCAHCYLGPREARDARVELSTGAVLALLGQLAEAGCLALALTGGEPLLRPDFREIWARAHALGFQLSLFSNGSLLDEATADFLAAHPPLALEVSLYGASPAGYAGLTGRPEAFAAVRTGLDLALARGLRVVLKALLLERLRPELEGMRALARARGLELRLDPGLHAALAGRFDPRAERLPGARAVAEELAEPGRRARLQAYDQAFRSQPEEVRAAPCAAGFHAFHLDPAGRLMACMLHRAPWEDAASRGFTAAWERLGAHPRMAFPPSSACAACELGHLCGTCPALDGLDEDRAYFCEVAHARARVLTSDTPGGMKEPAR
jgi:radical SAM protein with 4Fe4S-binding SPASM domain